MYTLRKIFAAVFLLSLTIFFTACGKVDPHITHDDAKRMMNSEPTAIILDVRTPEEFDKKHIKGALLVPIDELQNGNFSALPDKDATILIYCWTGRRAEDAAKILIDNGYKKVFEFGGLVDWTGEVEGSEVSSP